MLNGSIPFNFGTVVKHEPRAVEALSDKAIARQLPHVGHGTSKFASSLFGS